MYTRRTLISYARRLSTAATATATTIRAGKVGGDISSLFPSLSGVQPLPLPGRFAAIKKRFVEGREDELVRSWERLLRDLDREVEVVKMFGSDVGVFFSPFYLGDLLTLVIDHSTSRV
jgi:hypothetical protein